jgi:hypothetical protein
LIASCGLCGQPFYPGEPLVPIPKFYIHPNCAKQDGRTAMEISDATQCCDARAHILSLGQCVVEKAPLLIPRPDEVWLVNRRAGEATVLRIHVEGPIALEPIHTIYPKGPGPDGTHQGILAKAQE